MTPPSSLPPTWHIRMWRRTRLNLSLSYQHFRGRLLPRIRIQGPAKNIAQNIAEFTTSQAPDIIPMSEAQNIEERGERSGGRGGGGRRNIAGRARADSRGGRRGGAGGGRAESRETAISKALSKLLRHAAEEEGVALDNEGFGRLDQVVSTSLGILEAISSRSPGLAKLSHPVVISHDHFIYDGLPLLVCTG
jgi:hypothetical protein